MLRLIKFQSLLVVLVFALAACAPAQAAASRKCRRTHYCDPRLLLCPH